MSTRGFTAIPNHIIRDPTIPPSTRLLYGVILSYAFSARSCTASAATLCEDTGIGRSAFFDGIALLREKGLLDVEKRKSPKGWRNVYVPVARGVELPDVDGGGSPTSGRRVVRDTDGGSSTTRTQKKTTAEEEKEPDGSFDRANEIDPRDLAPVDFPDELREHGKRVMEVLEQIASEHNCPRPRKLQLGRILMEHSRKRLVYEAGQFLIWSADPPRPIKNVVTTYQTFLVKSRDELAGPERLDGDRPLPSGVTAIRPRNQSAAERRQEGGNYLMRQLQERAAGGYTSGVPDVEA